MNKLQQGSTPRRSTTAPLSTPLWSIGTIGTIATLVVIFTIGTLQVSCQGKQRSSPTHQARAEQLVQQGRLLWDTRQPADLVSSLEHFQHATELHADSAPAWAGVADASALLGLYAIVPPRDTMPRALAAAERALSLAPPQSSTYASLGLAQYLYAWDFSSAEHSFQQAIDLDKDNSGVRHWYAMMLSALGRHQEAIDQIEKAVALSTSSPLLNTKLVTVLTAAEEMDRAEAAAQSAALRFPEYALVQREIGFLRLRQQRFGEASHAFLRSLGATSATPQESNPEQRVPLSIRTSGNPRTLAALCHSLARDGATEEAENLLKTLVNRRAKEHISPMAIAHALAGLGHLEEAFSELQKALREKDPGLVYLYAKAGYDQLGTQRLATLASEVGLRP